jgi:uncharacterized protein (TIGR01244 family)
MSVTDAFNYKKVSETVATAGVLSTQQLETLRQEGFKAVINLLPDDSEYAQPGEQSCIEQQGLSYHYIPVDFKAPLESDYHTFATAMTALQGQKLVVHCATNYRVSAFYAIFAHRNLGWSEEEARAHIASLWNPSEYTPWEVFISVMLQGDQ